MYITQSLKNIFMKLLSISQIFILSLTIMSSFYHNMQVTTLLLWLMIFCCMFRLTTCFCGIYLPSLFENVRVMGYNKPVKEQVFFYMNAHSFLYHHIIILLKQVTTLLLITLTHRFLVLTQIAMLTAKITYNQDRPRSKRVYFQFMVLQFFRCQLGYYTNLYLLISWKNPFPY